ncbi:MAG: DUF2239 family protein [Gemmatimonadales bacterium]
MTNPAPTSATGFLGTRMVASGPLPRVAPAMRAALDRDPSGDCLAFDDATGSVIDLDLRGSVAEVGARYASGAMPAVQPPPKEPSRRSPGRPKLGVVGKELTLLPRHWEWLAAQPGGASATVRRLIDQARKAGAGRESRRRAQEAAYGFIRVLGGNLEGFEEATRALFAGDGARFAALIEDWPEDVAAYARRLAEPGFAAADADR